MAKKRNKKKKRGKNEENKTEKDIDERPALSATTSPNNEKNRDDDDDSSQIEKMVSNQKVDRKQKQKCIEEGQGEEEEPIIDEHIENEGNDYEMQKFILASVAQKNNKKKKRGRRAVINTIPPRYPVLDWIVGRVSGVVHKLPNGVLTFLFALACPYIKIASIKKPLFTIWITLLYIFMVGTLIVMIRYTVNYLGGGGDNYQSFFSEMPWNFVVGFNVLRDKFNSIDNVGWWVLTTMKTILILLSVVTSISLLLYTSWTCSRLLIRVIRETLYYCCCCCCCRCRRRRNNKRGRVVIVDDDDDD